MYAEAIWLHIVPQARPVPPLERIPRARTRWLRFASLATVKIGAPLSPDLAVMLVQNWRPILPMLVVTVVLTVQALLFADGGLTALGINILNMAVVTAVVGWLVFRVGVRFVQTPKGAALIAGVAAFLSVPAAAMAFTLEYALGGTAPVSLTAVAAAMGGVHLLIGIGEGVITGLVVAAVLASRPDVVAGVRGTPLAQPRIREAVAA